MEQYGGSIERVASTVTAAGTTTLINTSAQIQVFTGTSSQTVILPVATTYTKAGAKFELYNRSTSPVPVEFQDASPLQTIPANASLIVKCVDNSTANGVWVTLSNSAVPSVSPPTIQKFLSGSGTYTTPTSPSPLYIRVTMVGGGGGGSGGGAGGSPGGSGSSGTASTFGTSLLVTNGGGGGVFADNGGAGGSASLGSGPIGIAYSGPTGQGADSQGLGAGGQGASTPLGGAGAAGSVDRTGFAAIANTGSGGGGGGGPTSLGGGTGSGSGGGAGGYVSAIINSPASTYSYTIGTGGSGGSVGGGGSGGGAAGAAGIIIVEEHYQ